MTALLEMKQKLKNFYGQYEGYLVPVFKFLLAFGYFWWIRTSLGMMERLSDPFVIIITALLCAILPANAIISPLIPIGCGLLGNPVAAIPVGCSVVFYHLITFIKEQESILTSDDIQIQRVLKLLMDGLVKEQDMWMALITFIGVLLMVYLIRTRSFDYAWRVAIIVGAVAYLSIMLAGGLFLGMDVEIVSLVISTLVSALLGFVLEFFAFGGDYTRTEHLEYEDDDYFYYVKAVPKVSISTSKRKIKKINGVSQKTEEIPQLLGRGQWSSRPPVDGPGHVDFEKKLEESLKDL